MLCSLPPGSPLSVTQLGCIHLTATRATRAVNYQSMIRAQTLFQQLGSLPLFKRYCIAQPSIKVSQKKGNK